mmetsp:Transcript_32652/g.94421  ORF Transcript_32652/g.94421 Transcript_32652/m.94421 type:complete len:202 (+) Transcript_32652:211-816(+)
MKGLGKMTLQSMTTVVGMDVHMYVYGCLYARSVSQPQLGGGPHSDRYRQSGGVSAAHWLTDRHSDKECISVNQPAQKEEIHTREHREREGETDGKKTSYSSSTQEKRPTLPLPPHPLTPIYCCGCCCCGLSPTMPSPISLAIWRVALGVAFSMALLPISSRMSGSSSHRRTARPKASFLGAYAPNLPSSTKGMLPVSCPGR